MENHIQSPPEIRQQIWRELGRASRDRHHAWRTPVLATAAEDGLVNARTVVLRDVDASRSRLIFFTDSRSPKVAELVQHPSALFVFWSGRLHWQLRVRVKVSVEASGPDVAQYWQSVRQSAGVKDYIGPVAPGTALGDDHKLPTATTEAHHFAVVNCQVVEMDWLEIGRGEHRRARFFGEQWEWLAP